MRSIIATSVAALVLGVLAALPLAAQVTKPAETVSSDTLQRAKIVGPLGSELGQFVTISGHCVPNPSKGQATLVKVETVDGKKLVTPVTVEVQRRDAASAKLEVGIAYTLRGYEWGGMEGWPVDPEHPAYAQSRSVGFYTWFVATSALPEPKPAAAD